MQPMQTLEKSFQGHAGRGWGGVGWGERQPPPATGTHGLLFAADFTKAPPAQGPSGLFANLYREGMAPKQY